MKNSITNSTKILILAITLSFGFSYVYAWTAPTATPPSGNVSAPLNTSATEQTKAGNINISAGSAYKINGSNIATALTALNNYFFGRAGNLTMTGTYNTALGGNALRDNAGGSYNTATGFAALQLNTSGVHNTATGYGSLTSNTTGSYNTANGEFALGPSSGNSSGSNNTASGYWAMSSNLSGSNNTANGFYALQQNRGGYRNTAMGYGALQDNGYSVAAGNFVTGTNYTITLVGTTNFMLIGAANNNLGTVFTATGPGSGTGYASPSTDNNSAIGYNSGRGIISGSGNSIFGANVTGLPANLTNNIILANGTGAIKAQHDGTNWTMAGNISASGLVNNLYLGLGPGSNNSISVAVGVGSLGLNTTGSFNTALGYTALRSNTGGYDNTAVGSSALEGNTIGNYNTAIGQAAGATMTSGSGNTAIGFNTAAGSTGSNNTAIGVSAGTYGVGLTNTTAIGAGATPLASNEIRLGNGLVTKISGQVGYTFPSDIRLKKDIVPYIHGLDFITKLRPVEYKLKSDTTNKQHSGFIAQEVEATGIPFYGLERPVGESDYYMLGYSEFVVPLVNAVKELKAENDKLKADNDDLRLRIEKIEAKMK